MSEVPSCPKCGSVQLFEHGSNGTTGKTDYKCQSCGRRTVNPVMLDCELRDASITLAKQKQKFQDTNRIERKAFRESTRLDNAVGAYTDALIKVFTDRNISGSVKTHKFTEQSMTPVIQISDVHFNELVEYISATNNYDFSIASKRFQKYADQVKLYISSYKKVKNVVVAFTGDLMNSDRRLDEMLSMATNRSNATFLAVKVIAAFLLDLNKSYNIICANVVGNESRLKEEIGYSKLVATDNYDFTIYNILDIMLSGKKGIIFNHDDNPTEQVITVQGQNILLVHGEQISSSSIDKTIQAIKGKYAENGIIIHYIMFGHLHAAFISDMFSRSSSMVGSNAFSDKRLNLSSRASQNLHLIFDDGSRDCIKIDLQYVEGYEGYPIDCDNNSYNPQGVNGNRQPHTILEIRNL